ncbi:MAG: 23S rRNA pseudouridine1911/1915/1917 synthase [Cognaticolwellia sp.]|jgi:23S rRNA pseudouridine1911/1915/1917 synthase
METPRLITHRDGLAWLYKPAGWNTHPTAEGGIDVVTWLDTQGKLLNGMRPAHRLDKPTSGILVVGRRNARSRVASSFEAGHCKKTYLALVYGRVRPIGKIEEKIDGKDAVTQVRLMGVYNVEGGCVSLLELTPQTGRKHQLRVHLHGIRHPIVGDARYRRNLGIKDPSAPERLWLHAAALSIAGSDPVRAPLPVELSSHLDILRLNPA